MKSVSEKTHRNPFRNAQDNISANFTFNLDIYAHIYLVTPCVSVHILKRELIREIKIRKHLYFSAQLNGLRVIP